MSKKSGVYATLFCAKKFKIIIFLVRSFAFFSTYYNRESNLRKGENDANDTIKGLASE